MIKVHDEVREALRDGRPVVALETAVLTTGLPRCPFAGDSLIDDPNWNPSEPTNLECVRAMQRAVRAENAVPATVAVMDGALHIGLDANVIADLAVETTAGKASVANLAAALHDGGRAGTTVSATLVACRMAEPHPIRVFATGGIGGVHRDWTSHPDVSSDLRQIATTPVCIVCSGAKSILDVPATVETLDALGVPILGYGTSAFPQFYCEGDDAVGVTQRVDTARDAAAICILHWSMACPTGGILLTNPVPASVALDPTELDAIIEQAEAGAIQSGMTGPARTPFVLDHVAAATAGRSLRANIALLVSNARRAAEMANALATTSRDIPSDLN